MESRKNYFNTFDGSRYKLDDFLYELPPDLIAQYPLEKRDACRLLTLNRENGEVLHQNFTDILQKRNRATVVGETTRGGAHSTGGPRVLNDYFIVKMPNGININPITKSNWEGVGVEPNIRTESKDALDTALKIIQKK